MPLQEQKLTGLKKRQQIESANRAMFLWIAAASVAISICIVTSQFFLQKFVYNNNVISAKLKAADTLKTNIDNAKKLKGEVDALVGNQDLAAVKTNPADTNTKSVLDALPSVRDSTALATSLQKAILNRSGVVIESISVPSANDAELVSTALANAAPVEQPFSISVSGSYDKIKGMILDIERTIRPIKITSLNVNGNDAAMRVSIEAVTYYQPPKTTNIKEEAVKQ